MSSLEPTCWSQGIGYARVWVVTGFHPLDGARYLGRRVAETAAKLTA